MDELLVALKDKLSITWDEEETNRKLLRILASGKKTLNFKLGANIDYSIAGPEQDLLLNYCMYSWNNCVNEFDTNYLNELLQIRQYYEVLAYETEEL